MFWLKQKFDIEMLEIVDFKIAGPQKLLKLLEITLNGNNW